MSKLSDLCPRDICDSVCVPDIGGAFGCLLDRVNVAAIEMPKKSPCLEERDEQGRGLRYSVCSIHHTSSFLQPDNHRSIIKCHYKIRM